MKQIARVIGRLISILIAKDVITKDEAFYILAPLQKEEGDPDDRA